jgi:hypothetical protein
MLTNLKYRTYKLINYILSKKGYQILNKKYLPFFENFTLNILEELESNLVNREIDSIVFSKDRAMQLYAFLSSYIDRVSNRGRMYILYTCSSARHQKSYDQLQETFVNEDFIFIKEREFREQLIEICKQSDARNIIFYVDDMIFTHKIDYTIFGKINTTKYILSLSRGKDLEYSVVLQRYLRQPSFIPANDNLECFRWDYLNEFSDWTYPLGVSGFMYGRIELVSMFKTLFFKSPSSLEGAMQLYLPFFKRRYGLCTEFASCVCIHANLVQQEFKNPVLGTFSIEELLELWEKGKRISLSEFYNKPMNITQVQKYLFT